MLRLRRLTVSLAANALLTAALVTSLLRPPPKAPHQPIASAPSIARPRRSLTTFAPNDPTDGSNSVRPEWTKWIRAVRASGVSGSALATLLIADFERRWEVYAGTLHDRLDAGEIDASAMTRLLARHDRAQERELREALDDAEFRAWKKEVLLRDLTSAHLALTDEERDRVFEARAALEASRRSLEDAHAQGRIDDATLADREAALGRECQAKVNAIIGDERLAEMSAVRDGVDASTRQTLRSFNLPTADLNALADTQRARNTLQADLEKQYGADPSYRARQLAVDAARDSTYESVLGPSRFDVWQKATDPRFQTMVRYSSALHMSASDIAATYATIEGQEKQAQLCQLQALSALESGRPVDWAAVQKEVADAKQNTETSLRAQLGDERFEQLRRNGVVTLTP